MDALSGGDVGGMEEEIVEDSVFISGFDVKSEDALISFSSSGAISLLLLHSVLTATLLSFSVFIPFPSPPSSPSSLSFISFSFPSPFIAALLLLLSAFLFIARRYASSDAFCSAGTQQAIFVGISFSLLCETSKYAILCEGGIKDGESIEIWLYERSKRESDGWRMRSESGTEGMALCASKSVSKQENWRISGGKAVRWLDESERWTSGDKEAEGGMFGTAQGSVEGEGTIICW